MRDKFCGLIGFDAGVGVAECGTAAEGANGIAGPRQEGQGQGLRNISPVMPLVQIGKTVGPHDPDEICLFHGVVEGEQGFSGIAGIHLLFDVSDHKAGMFGDAVW